MVCWWTVLVRLDWLAGGVCMRPVASAARLAVVHGTTAVPVSLAATTDAAVASSDRFVVMVTTSLAATVVVGVAGSGRCVVVMSTSLAATVAVSVAGGDCCCRCRWRRLCRCCC